MGCCLVLQSLGDGRCWDKSRAGFEEGKGKNERLLDAHNSFGLHTEGYVERLGTGLLKRKLLHCHRRQASEAFLSPRLSNVEACALHMITR
jgi:hypothetical protein